MTATNVVRFPLELRIAAPARQGSDDPAEIIILPVVRIERDGFLSDNTTKMVASDDR